MSAGHFTKRPTVYAEYLRFFRICFFFPCDSRSGAAVVSVDPCPVPRRLLVAPRVGKASMLARVAARLAVRGQTERAAHRMIAAA